MSFLIEMMRWKWLKFVFVQLWVFWFVSNSSMWFLLIVLSSVWVLFFGFKGGIVYLNESFSLCQGSSFQFIITALIYSISCWVHSFSLLFIHGMWWKKGVIEGWCWSKIRAVPILSRRVSLSRVGGWYQVNCIIDGCDDGRRGFYKTRGRPMEWMGE